MVWKEREPQLCHLFFSASAYFAPAGTVLLWCLRAPLQCLCVRVSLWSLQNQLVKEVTQCRSALGHCCDTQENLKWCRHFYWQCKEMSGRLIVTFFIHIAVRRSGSVILNHTHTHAQAHMHLLRCPSLIKSMVFCISPPFIPFVLFNPRQKKCQIKTSLCLCRLVPRIHPEESKCQGEPTFLRVCVNVFFLVFQFIKNSFVPSFNPAALT